MNPGSGALTQRWPARLFRPAETPSMSRSIPAVSTRAYVSNFGGSRDLSVYSVQSGNLVPIEHSQFRGGNGSQGVAVDSTSRFVYVANQGSGEVSGYVNTGRGLRKAHGSPFAAPAGPFGIATCASNGSGCIPAL